MKKIVLFIAIAISVLSCSKDENIIAPEKIQTIIPILKPGDTGSAVVNLQNSLFRLYDSKIFKTYNAPNQPTNEYLQQLILLIKTETSNQIFGEATKQLLLIFQIQQGLGDNLHGIVESETAAKLNEILQMYGLLG